MQCFKIKRGTNFDKSVKEHFRLLPKWKNVFNKLNDYMGEEIRHMALNPNMLYIDTNDLNREENKKLFTKEGKLKKNLKDANELKEKYEQIIKEEGLESYQELGMINFAYGVMRMRGQYLESFRTSEDDVYYKADFDLESSSKGMVEPISEVEYAEKYLEEIKKREDLSA